eukprot:gene13559-19430_t
MPPMEEDEQFMLACPNDEDLLLVAHSEDFSAGEQFMPAYPDDEDLLLVAHIEDFSAGQ